MSVNWFTLVFRYGDWVHGIEVLNEYKGDSCESEVRTQRSIHSLCLDREDLTPFLALDVERDRKLQYLVYQVFFVSSKVIVSLK